MVDHSNVPEVLFFIPDIGGFTKFVTETEISHSRHIIGVLLELLVDSNEIGLEVSEFEGDAVFFFRTGALPSVGDLIAQSLRMYRNFHQHLRQQEQLRVCQCGACSRMHKLTLKFVAHAGPATTMEVKGRTKFIGRSVIVVHRLLKNNVADKEYLLVTQEALDRLGGIAQLPTAFVSGLDTYEAIGEVEYQHHSLRSYRDERPLFPKHTIS